MRQFFRSLLPSFDRDRLGIQRINAKRREFAALSDDERRHVATQTDDLLSSWR